MKNLTIWLILGLILRLFLITSTFHPDIKAYNLAAHLIAQNGQILSFYDYISKLPRNHPFVGIYGDGQFNYPPLAYLSHAIFNFFLEPFYPKEAWKVFIYDSNNFRNTYGFGLLLFYLKIPYLFADLLCLLVLRQLINDQKQNFLASILWVFNPLTIYSAYMMGQFDIFITLFIGLALLLSRKHQSWAAVILGFAAGFKPFPLFLLPFLGEGVVDKIKTILLGLLTYILIISPYLGSTAFKHYALFADQSDKMLYAKVIVSGSQYLSLFIVGLVVLYWLNFFWPKLLVDWGWWLSPLLLFFSVTHFHPQWFTWMAMLLVISIIKIHQSLWPILVILGCYILIIFSFDSSLHFGLFGWYKELNISDQTTSIVRSVLMATSLIFIKLLSKDEE